MDMKDVFMQFMERTESFVLGSIRFQLHSETETVQVTDMDSDTEYPEIDSMEELRDLIFEHDFPFRVCQACGSPMMDGFSDDMGETYFCKEEEFAADMNFRYGKGNWRAEPTGKRDWCYEYREDKDSEWIPEPSFWTHWY